MLTGPSSQSAAAETGPTDDASQAPSVAKLRADDRLIREVIGQCASRRPARGGSWVITNAIPVLQSIAPLAATADLVVDIWGVMHNGERPYASPVAACEAFRRQGGTFLVTNSPRPRESVARSRRHGVARTAYDGIVSSGDVSQPTEEWLASRSFTSTGAGPAGFANLQATPGASRMLRSRSARGCMTTRRDAR